MSHSQEQPLRLLRPRPVEIVIIGFFVVGFLVLKLAGRPYFLSFDEYLLLAGKQALWLAPCFLIRYLVRLFDVPPEKARRIYLSFFFVLTVLFFVLPLEQILTRSHLHNRTSLLVRNIGWASLGMFAVVAAITASQWKKHGEKAKAILREDATDLHLIARLVLFLALCFSMYSNLKVAIPLLPPKILHDGLLYRIDRILFFGADPFAILTSIDSIGFRVLMSRSYFFFFFFIVFGLSGAFLFGSVRYFEKVLATFVLGYVIGMVFYILIPSWGPAFFAQTQSFFEATSDNQLKRHLLGQLNLFLRNPATAEVRPFAGLAAFPSLHIAHSLLFMYYLWFREKILVYILAIPFVLLTVSTLYLGWHYVVDGIGAVMVAALTIIVVEKMYPREQEAAAEGEEEAQETEQPATVEV